MNNVGTNIRKPTTALTNDEISQVFATNLSSALSLCRAAERITNTLDRAMAATTGFSSPSEV